MNHHPNLFSFATSELSQDAFICWLLSWANPKISEPDKELHQCAITFIKALFKKHKKSVPEIKEIKIKKQDKNIDVLCTINNEYTILIEDKTGTKHHSNQLERYYEDVKRRDFLDDKILPIYYKTEDQGKYSGIEEANYKLFLRKDILEVLDSYSGNNAIIIDYRNHLQSISDGVESYLKLPIEEWEKHSWVGFYIRLQKELKDGNWDNVPNKSGGFLGMWWHHQGNKDCRQYLQLEKEKLCFKISVNKTEDRKRLRGQWYKTIKEKSGEYKLALTKPARFGSGKYMTVCIHDGEYRHTDSDGIINIEKTVSLLQKAESLLRAVNIE